MTERPLILLCDGNDTASGIPFSSTQRITLGQFLNLLIGGWFKSSAGNPCINMYKVILLFCCCPDFEPSSHPGHSKSSAQIYVYDLTDLTVWTRVKICSSNLQKKTAQIVSWLGPMQLNCTCIVLLQVSDILVVRLNQTSKESQRPHTCNSHGGL